MLSAATRRGAWNNVTARHSTEMEMLQKAMVAKRLGFQAKEEEELQGAIQQLNTNVRAKADASETPRLQRQACAKPAG